MGIKNVWELAAIVKLLIIIKIERCTCALFFCIKIGTNRYQRLWQFSTCVCDLHASFNLQC